MLISCRDESGSDDVLTSQWNMVVAKLAICPYDDDIVLLHNERNSPYTGTVHWQLYGRRTVAALQDEDVHDDHCGATA